MATLSHVCFKTFYPDYAGTIVQLEETQVTLSLTPVPLESLPVHLKIAQYICQFFANLLCFNASQITLPVDQVTRYEHFTPLVSREKCLLKIVNFDDFVCKIFVFTTNPGVTGRVSNGRTCVVDKIKFLNGSSFPFLKSDVYLPMGVIDKNFSFPLLRYFPYQVLKGKQNGSVLPVLMDEKPELLVVDQKAYPNPKSSQCYDFNIEKTGEFLLTQNLDFLDPLPPDLFHFQGIPIQQAHFWNAVTNQFEECIKQDFEKFVHENISDATPSTSISLRNPASIALSVPVVGGYTPPFIYCLNESILIIAYSQQYFPPHRQAPPLEAPLLQKELQKEKKKLLYNFGDHSLQIDVSKPLSFDYCQPSGIVTINIPYKELHELPTE